MSLSFDSLQTLLQSRQRYLILMILIMAMLVLGPILEGFVAIRVIINVFLTAIVLLITGWFQCGFFFSGFFKAPPALGGQSPL